MILKIIFSLLLIIHTIIHLFGFFKAFNIFEKVVLIKSKIPKIIGIFWLLSSLLFLITFILLSIIKHKGWYYFGFAGFIISQLLIILTWEEAKYGTIINIIILIILLLKFSSINFESKFKSESRSYLQVYNNRKTDIIEVNKLNNLPEILKRYIIYCKLNNKEDINNLYASFYGKIFFKKNNKFFYFNSHQFNFIDKNVRLFFMKAKMFGIPVYAYHKYINGNASMVVKICGLIPIIKASGEDLNVSETVTYFNDLCLLAPSALTNKNIIWKQLTDTSVIAYFKIGQFSISAELIFDKDGKLLNFISYDRTDITTNNKIPFHTPVLEYSYFGNKYLPSHGKAIWYYSTGPFTYIDVYIKNIYYNLPLKKSAI